MKLKCTVCGELFEREDVIANPIGPLLRQLLPTKEQGGYPDGDFLCRGCLEVLKEEVVPAIQRVIGRKKPLASIGSGSTQSWPPGIVDDSNGVP